MGDNDPVSPALILYKYSLQMFSGNPPFRLSGTALVSVETSKHGNKVSLCKIVCKEIGTHILYFTSISPSPMSFHYFIKEFVFY